MICSFKITAKILHDFKIKVSDLEILFSVLSGPEDSANGYADRSIMQGSVFLHGQLQVKTRTCS